MKNFKDLIFLMVLIYSSSLYFLMTDKGENASASVIEMEEMVITPSDEVVDEITFEDETLIVGSRVIEMETMTIVGRI